MSDVKQNDACPHGHARRRKCGICDREDDQAQIEALAAENARLREVISAEGKEQGRLYDAQYDGPEYQAACLAARDRLTAAIRPTVQPPDV